LTMTMMATMTNVDWADHAVCANHPVLHKNAWLKLNEGHPKGEGSEAVIVCRMACPVRVECEKWYRGRDVIAGGGWFGSNGAYRGADQTLMDAHQAAAYIGVTVNTIYAWRSTKRLVSVKFETGRNWFKTEDVVRLAKNHGPRHGTSGARRLHLIRGEDMCVACRASTKVDLLPVA
jgi:hypothetical protein